MCSGGSVSISLNMESAASAYLVFRLCWDLPGHIVFSRISTNKAFNSSGILYNFAGFYKIRWILMNPLDLWKLYSKIKFTSEVSKTNQIPAKRQIPANMPMSIFWVVFFLKTLIGGDSYNKNEDSMKMYLNMFCVYFEYILLVNGIYEIPQTYLDDQRNSAKFKISKKIQRNSDEHFDSSRILAKSWDECLGARRCHCKCF